MAEFDKTGRIEWVTDLAEIPAKFGVKNVYGELGTAFATCCVTNPRFAAAFIGTLIRGPGRRAGALGHGFRLVRLAAVADRGHAPARDPGGHAQEAQVRGAGRGRRPGQDRDLRGNASKLYNLNVKAALGAITNDKIAAIRAEYVAAGGERSNARYGYVARPSA